MISIVCLVLEIIIHLNDATCNLCDEYNSDYKIIFFQCEGVLENYLPVFLDGVMCNGKPLRYLA